VSFGDTIHADEVTLRNTITVRHPDTKNWITGKVFQLALVAKDGSEVIRIFLQTDTGYAFYVDLADDAPVIYEIGDPSD
jgi:hypothetical protein